MTTQDLRFQVPITIASGVGTGYLAVPYRSAVRDVRGIFGAAASVGASTSDAAVTVEQVVASASDVTVGQTAWAKAGLAAGGKGTYTPDASSGNTVLPADDVLKFSFAMGSSSTSATGNILLDIELDPFARKL